MLPAKLAAEAAGAADPARVAWQAGLVGLRRLGADRARRRLRRRAHPPRRRRARRCSRRSPASRSPSSRSASSSAPTRGRSSGSRRSAIVLLVYFGRVRFRGGLPGGLVAVAARHAARLDAPGIAPVGARAGDGRAASILPMPVLGDLLAALAGGNWLAYLSVILPMGLFNVVGSLQNIESAEAAGDSLPDRARRSPSTASARSPRRSSAPASRPRSTSAIRAGRRWARAPATRCSTPRSSPSSASPARSPGSPGRCRSTPAWRSCCGSAS